MYVNNINPEHESHVVKPYGIGQEEGRIVSVRLTQEEVDDLGLENDNITEEKVESRLNEKSSKTRKPAKTNTSKKYDYLMKTLTVGHLADGTPVRKKVYAKTEQELEEKYNEMKRKYTTHRESNDTTVEEWGARWLRVHKALKSRKNRDGYESRLRLHIYPKIGNMSLNEVRNSDLQLLMNSFANKNKGYVQHIMQTIKQLFRDAESEGLIYRNPAARLSMPRTAASKKTKAFNESDLQVIDKVAANHEHGNFMIMLRYTGLRSGELAALKWTDVDIDNQRITVTDGVSLDDDYRAVLSGSTKGDKIRGELFNDNNEIVPRIVPIPNALLPTLVKLQGTRIDDGLLFPWKGGCLPVSARLSWWNSFKRQCHIEAGAELGKYNKVIPESSPFDDSYTMRSFRNTYCTMLRSAGIDKTGREDFLGHKRTDVNDLYTGWSEDDYLRNAEKLNAWIDGRQYVEGVISKQTKPVNTQTITTIINTALYNDLINASMKRRLSLGAILSDALNGFVDMYGASIRGTPMEKAIVVPPLSDSVIAVDISADNELFDSMDTIAVDISVSSVELYSYAIEWHAARMSNP